MAFCPNCKTFMQDDYTFCGICGDKLYRDRVPDYSVPATESIRNHPIGRCSRRALSRLINSDEMLDKAISIYKDSQKKFPNYADISFDLGILYRSQNKMEDALSQLAASARMNPRFGEARQALGDTYYDLNQYEAAVVEYQRASEINPGYPDLYVSLGRTYLKLLRFTDAIREFEKALHLNPNMVEARAELEKIQYHQSPKRENKHCSKENV